METRKRSSRAILRRLIGTFAMLAFARASAFAATPPPAADIVQSFSTPPPAEWTIAGPLAWDRSGGAMLSSPTATATALWSPGRYFTGTLTCWVKLVAGRSGIPPKASLIFARDPGTGASRWVSVSAGPAGVVALGQSGTIRGSAARTIKSVRTSVPFNTWQKLSLKVDGAGKVTVTLGAKPLFTAVAGPLAPGAVGFSSDKSKVAFRGFSFTNNPDAEPCAECHAGQGGQPLAADVFTYWDGSWWDSNHGGSAAVQQGGHGDAAGKAATGCTGATGCHDQRLPTPGDHRNGVREPFSAPTPNTFHLKSGYIAQNPVNTWDVALTFDNFCTTACHGSSQVREMRHSPANKEHLYVQMGAHLSYPDGRNFPPNANVPFPADLSSASRMGTPVYSVCVTCHDPHGTGTLDTGQLTFQPSTRSNHMLRQPWVVRNDLCHSCHL